MAPQIFAIASFLSITWGIYLLGTIRAYQETKGNPHRRRQDMVVAFRRFVVALCAWLFVFSFVFRTFCVIAGVGDELAGQIVFYALLGANIPGSIFACVSLRYD